MKKKFSAIGVGTLKSIEGCELESYRCEAGKWSIGFGHTLGVKEGDVITYPEALRLLYQDITESEDDVNRLCPNVNQNQYDALVIFHFNVGGPQFSGSTLLKKVRVNPNDPTIKDEFLKWNKVNAEHDGKDNDNDGLIDEKGEKKVSKGLINREIKTSNLYFTPCSN